VALPEAGSNETSSADHSYCWGAFAEPCAKAGCAWIAWTSMSTPTIDAAKSVSLILASLLAMALTDFLLFVVGACGAPRRRRRRRQATTLRASDANSRTAGLEIRTAISVSAEYPTCALELILRHQQPHPVDAAFPRRADADDDARHAFGLERDPVEVGLDAGRVGHERNHLRVHSASPLVEIANPWRRPRR